MEHWIWGAVVVALVVLAKTLWDVYGNSGAAPVADDADLLGDGSIAVVSRERRRELARRGLSLQAVPELTDNVAAEEVVTLRDDFPANDELDTVRFVVPAEAAPAAVASNVISLESHKRSLPEDAMMAGDDDDVDPLALSQSQSRVVEAQDYVIVYVKPLHVPFDGERLLKAALNYGLRFGEMSMFHRHEHPNGQGEVLFSMARADEVGAFDLETMTGEFVPAITLFMGLPSQQPALAYDMMIDTARRIAAELNGEVLDQNQNPLNRQLVDHYREDMLEYTRRQLMGVAVAV